ncbi:hypothetical protein FRC03_008360 [Tulasnella sp. 419]|nr:hypothetical protein FRC02_007412 [Tulasnella sp. 418]KAG8959174.1 hypothetical protein FRC03_008360 [Tulasnella sp. 419]
MRLDGGLKTEVAMKLLRFHGRITSQLNIKHLERAFKEVYIWTRLNHPNIAEFCGFVLNGDPNELPIIISPWCRKGNLVRYLDEEPLHNRLFLLHDVASAVKYLHSKSIVHGDIKGENVLIDDFGHGRLCDFGLSHFFNDFSDDLASLVQLSSAYLGCTLRYSSPELVESERSTPMSDVWALGCLAMQILTDQIPYAQLQTKGAITRSIKQGYPPYDMSTIRTTNSLEHVLLDTISKCWEKDPPNRPSASQIFDNIDDLIGKGLVCIRPLSVVESV